eukprot:Rhum_TRINITY_DN25402_c0_g1::Rhum_TRINITY_DN25402_c0_g1_i1::g.182054::m.182054
MRVVGHHLKLRGCTVAVMLVVWLLALLHIAWVMGRSTRGEVEPLSDADAGVKAPFAPWVVGTMIVVDCDRMPAYARSLRGPGGAALTEEEAARRATKGVVSALGEVLRHVRVSAVVFRHECHDGVTFNLPEVAVALHERAFIARLGVKEDAHDAAAAASSPGRRGGGAGVGGHFGAGSASSKQGPHSIVKFTPHLTEAGRARLLAYVGGGGGGSSLVFLTKGKEYEYQGERGRLLDFSAQGTLDVLRQYMRVLAERGARGVWAEPADQVLVGNIGETEEAGRVVNQRMYSRGYYWTLFDLGREIVGHDFVVLGAGVTSFEGVGTDLRLVPPDVGMAAVARMSTSPRTALATPVETLYYAFKTAAYGYLSFAAPPVPLFYREGLFVDTAASTSSSSSSAGGAKQQVESGRHAVQVAAGLPLLLLLVGMRELVSLVEDALPTPSLDHVVRRAASLHSELGPYLHSSASVAFRHRASLVRPLALGPPDGRAPDAEEALRQSYAPPRDHAFYLGSDVVVCPRLDADSAASCTPPRPEEWTLATSRALDPLTHLGLREMLSEKGPAGSAGGPLILKRLHRGLPLRPYGDHSLLLWAQYGLAPPQGLSYLTTVWDAPLTRTHVNITGQTRRRSLTLSLDGLVSGGVGMLALRVTPWHDRQLVVLRGMPIAAHNVQDKAATASTRHTFGFGPGSSFFRYDTLEALRGAVAGDRGSLADDEELDPDVSGYYAAGRELFLFLPELPKGRTVLISSDTAGDTGTANTRRRR